MTMKKVLVLVVVGAIGTYFMGFFSGSLWSLIFSAIGGSCLGNLVAKIQSLLEEVESLRGRLAALEATTDAHAVLNEATLSAVGRLTGGEK